MKNQYFKPKSIFRLHIKLHELSFWKHSQFVKVICHTGYESSYFEFVTLLWPFTNQQSSSQYFE